MKYKTGYPNQQVQAALGRLILRTDCFFEPFSGPGLKLNDLNYLKTNNDVMECYAALRIVYVYFKDGALWWVTARRKKTNLRAER
jgi:hypothetical protein